MSGVDRKMMVGIVRKIPWLELGAEALENSSWSLMQHCPRDFGGPCRVSRPLALSNKCSEVRDSAPQAAGGEQSAALAHARMRSLSKS